MAHAPASARVLVLCALLAACGDMGTPGRSDGGDGGLTSAGDGDAGLPPNPGPGGRYLGIQDGLEPVVTPKSAPIGWGAAPPIDPNYGGELYAGTSSAVRDPRPALDVTGNEPLRLWVADPNDGRTNRPAIVWVHGGGFATGIDTMYALASSSGRAYAQRGYVGFSIEYRIDTTVIVDGQKVTTLCQWVQDNADPTSALWTERRDTCERAIRAARRDGLAAVRWIRQHADEYGVDPAKIAIGGFSAGAVIAASTAYESDDVGSAPYFANDPLTASASSVQAAFGASGCMYSLDGGPPSTIGPGDAPTSFIHSEKDPAVPYACATASFGAARAVGLTAELRSYCGVGGHGSALYDGHEAETDDQWTVFLARELRLYSGMRAPSSDPFCSGT